MLKMRRIRPPCKSNHGRPHQPKAKATDPVFAMPSAKIPDALRRVFLEAFTARDIAEPLASFDAGAPSAEVREFMQTCDFDVVGVRLEGRVSAYATRGALSDGDCGQYALRLEDAV